jgi:hypothetical protein
VRIARDAGVLLVDAAALLAAPNPISAPVPTLAPTPRAPIQTTYRPSSALT